MYNGIIWNNLGGDNLVKIERNYKDPNHLKENLKKKKEKKNKNNKENLEEEDIVFGEKDEDAKKVEKKKINGHEWLTFKVEEKK